MAKHKYEMMRPAILGLLVECEGNCTEVARRLGWTRQTVHNYLVRLKIDAARFRQSRRERAA